MDDFNFWWYIIAAAIYFFTRGRKKKKAEKQARPGSENNPSPSSRPKSFEELLREITEGVSEKEVEEPEQEPVVVRSSPKTEERKSFEQEGRRRVFADDESRRVYEESIKMAEGADLEFAPNENFKSDRLFKDQKEEERTSFAQELMDGFDTDEAKKALIYSEIFNRKY